MEITNDDLLKKIENEYEIFYLDTIKMPRANLYARTGEIEIKKSIVRYLKENVSSFPPRNCLLLFLIPNILDECYRYVCDYPEENFEVAMMRCLEFLAEKKKMEDVETEKDRLEFESG